MKIVDVPEEGRRFVTLFTIAQKVGNCSRKERNAETIKRRKKKKEKKKVNIFLDVKHLKRNLENLEVEMTC